MPTTCRSTCFDRSASPVRGLPAFGGWVMSAVDMLRFVLAVDGRRAPALLHEEMLAEIAARPAYAKDALAYRGLGFMIRPVAGRGVNRFHDGYLVGSVAFFASFVDGITIVFLTNGSPARDDQVGEIMRELQNALS